MSEIFASSDMANISYSWWLRSAVSANTDYWFRITNGYSTGATPDRANAIVPAFVIGGQTPTIPTPNPGEPVTPPAGDGTGSLPTPNLTGAVANAVSPITYEWSELKALAQANLSADVLKNTYGIEVGDYKKVNGTRYVLVDLGCDDDGDGIRNNYAGFVFNGTLHEPLAL